MDSTCITLIHMVSEVCHHNGGHEKSVYLYVLPQLQKIHIFENLSYLVEESVWF